MDIMSIANLKSSKSLYIQQPNTKIDTAKQSFSHVFNNERKSLSNKSKNFEEASFIKNKQTMNTLKREPVDTPNREVEVSKSSSQSANENIKAVEKKRSNDLTSLEDIEEIATIEKKSTLDIDPVLLESIISMLQVLLAASETNIGDVNVVDVELDEEQIIAMTSLQDQLNTLATSIKDDMDPKVQANVEEVLTMLKSLTVGDSKSKNISSPLSKEELSQALISFKDLEKSIKELKANLIPTKDQNKITLGAMEINVEPYEKSINLHEIPKAEKSMSSDEKDLEVKIKNVDKSSDENQFDGQPMLNAELDEVLFNQNINTPTGEKIYQKIDVKVIKNEILEPKQFISEIAQKAGAFLSKDRNEMNIQLSPENLGKITIKIGLNDGSLTGKIYAENFSVKEIIEANLDQLRDSLGEKGLNIAGLDVEVGDNSSAFRRNLFQSNSRKGQSTRSDSVNAGEVVGAFDMEENKINPYLISSQFEGQV